jgi:serine/threonine protein kinase
MTDPLLQRNLGPYRLRRVVGRGGMGTVYAALNQQTDQVAAVKVLSPTLASDPNFRERFSAEIESLKKLRHPNIVQLYGYGEQDGQLYYAMELIEGSSLQEELRRRRRFTWREVTQIAIDVCAALKHAHDHGIIHRDLKPANLLYTKDDTVKLLDFGIAKLFGNTGVTTGSVMGTADYMAPEQAEGKAVSPRSDLYSLGSVMYALLAGRPPFVGKSVPEVVHKVRYESPMPVNRLAADVPVELDHLIEQLLEKNPQKRVPTALATAHRLKAMVHALSIRRDIDERAERQTDVAGAAPAANVLAEANPNEQETIQLDHGPAGDQAVKHLAIITSERDAETGPDHFTVVTAQRDDHGERFPWQILPLAILFVAILWATYQGVRWAARPASADQLYAQIRQAADAATPARLVDVEAPMAEFLALYPRDPRVNEVQQWQSRLELHRLQRRLEDQARRRQDPPASAMEAVYLDILPLIRTQPAEAAERLQAFIDLYALMNPANEPSPPILRLAYQQLEQLATELQQQAALHGPVIEQQLSAARQLAATDPQQARRIYHGLIRLYGDKPWARPLVEQARQESAALPEPSRPGDG